MLLLTSPSLTHASPFLPLLVLVKARAIVQIEVSRSLNSVLANIRHSFNEYTNENVYYTYGSCCAKRKDDSQQLIASTNGETHDRLVWKIANHLESSGCNEQESDIDTAGPWFDGVTLLEDNMTAVDTAAAKAKDIAIIGAGMAGLMIWTCLSSLGMNIIRIVEASQRLGGRVHTAYFGDPSERQYQDKLLSTNESLEIQDQKLTFDFVKEVNRLNSNDPNVTVNLIPWIQNSPNGLTHRSICRTQDGTIPTISEIVANASLGPPLMIPDAETTELLTKLTTELFNPAFISELFNNMFQAHNEWLTSGLGGQGENWSEFGHMHNYLGYSLNAIDQALEQLYGGPAGSFRELLTELNYFSATDWKTIDGGLSRLPEAFHPLTETFDYAISTVLFPILRSWRLPAVTGAIATYPYATACKVVLQFRTRFWEHLKNPIYGSCSTTTDIPGIGTVCYPSYDINSTGPGVMLAQYTTPNMGDTFYVLSAIFEIHGDIAPVQYTGQYNRRRWALDEYETVGWAMAPVGARSNRLKAFFETEKNVIFAGEGASYTRAWIANALESGVRASVQLLLGESPINQISLQRSGWLGGSVSNRRMYSPIILKNALG
ncbi:hypothetical protein M501DRAFT_1025661 [Patellaria atrata CBS 101060]|uniref:Amine oxidase domain-containing protein n=1 Tax=Patellaria atrata CBS 101060 TaxID=1346257 RepID=A0A9P4VPR1_9PEZI|nr:hypothetical protein M501DRAFT_1025661 [Patellaria atrata CBS 101060]